MPRGSNSVVFLGMVGTFTVAAALALSVVAFGGPVDAQTAGCGTIQGRVNTAPSGATVDLPDGCVYRETVSVNKPLTLRGGPGVEIRGSDVWTNWTKSGVYWVKGTLPSFIVKGECKTGTGRCRWPEQVFFDGRPLLQVASNPKSGQFAVNPARQVVLADDPAGHRVEVSTRRQWVVGGSGGVTIENFSMRHAANEAQTGAIKNAVPGIAQGYDNWTVRNNRLSYAHGPLVTLGAATGLRLTGNDIHHSGQLGVNGSYASLEVLNNKIHHNNTEDFRTDWAAGGMKNTHMTRLVADGNEVYENDWTGLWCDEGCRNVTYSNNRVHHNKKRGIHFEISDGATITGNVLWENGWGVETSGDPGIVVVASRDVDVGYNTLAWNNDGILVVNADRPHGDGTQYDLVKNVRVHHNDILAKDYPGGSHLALNWIKAYAGGNIYDAAANNRGHDNRYWYPSAEGSPIRYGWSSKYPRLPSFSATLGEERGRYLSTTEKNSLVASKGIPASPER